MEAWDALTSRRNIRQFAEAKARALLGLPECRRTGGPTPSLAQRLRMFAARAISSTQPSTLIRVESMTRS